MDELIQRVGNTPLVKLLRLNGADKANVFVKMESLNPGGSIKDRPARHMLLNAIRKGIIHPGGVIVEPTSGNTGIGLAWIGRRLGFSVIIVMPDSVSTERIKLLEFLGAEVVLTPAGQGMQGSIDAAKQIVRSNQAAWMPSQFSNPDNPNAHYQTTGPEIWNQLNGKVDVLLAGVGTGGTLSGTGKYLKEQNPAIKIYAIEPENSYSLRGGQAALHMIPGISPGFVPENYNAKIVNGVLAANDDQSAHMRRQLGAMEGISCGISSGANVMMALQLAQIPEFAGNNIVTFVCDTGERYLSMTN